jgi:hypothetical protein
MINPDPFIAPFSKRHLFRLAINSICLNDGVSAVLLLQNNQLFGKKNHVEERSISEISVAHNHSQHF